MRDRTILYRRPQRCGQVSRPWAPDAQARLEDGYCPSKDSQLSQGASRNDFEHTIFPKQTLANRRTI
jgi:hypothetical protein